VRTLGVTAAISLVVHGAALAYVLHREKPQPAPPVAPPPAVTVEAAPREAELVIVDLVDPIPPAVSPPERGADATPDATPARPGAPRRASRPRRPPRRSSGRRAPSSRRRSW
jgi:hypothetical protein